jgi:hypothetical protein
MLFLDISRSYFYFTYSFLIKIGSGRSNSYSYFKDPGSVKTVNKIDNIKLKAQKQNIPRTIKAQYLSLSFSV